MATTTPTASTDYAYAAAKCRIAVGNARIAADRYARTGREDDRRIADDLQARAVRARAIRDAVWTSLDPAVRGVTRP